MLYYLSQQILDWAHGTAWESRLSFLRLFRYITRAQRGRGDHGAGVELVARAENHPLAEDIEIRPGLRRPGAKKPAISAARVLSKKGTPTMGGLLIVAVLVFSTMLWTQWNAQVELTLLSVLVLAGLGFYDDYAKIFQQSGGGTPPRVKLRGAIRARSFRRNLSLEASGDERIDFPRQDQRHLSNPAQQSRLAI